MYKYKDMILKCKYDAKTVLKLWNKTNIQIFQKCAIWRVCVADRSLLTQGSENKLLYDFTDKTISFVVAIC